MTYSALTATVSIMRTGNDDVLTPSKYTDTDLLNLNKTAAKLEMQMDLEAALGIETTDTTTLDEVTDNFSPRLGRALSYKQLALFYQTNDSGIDTKNRYRFELYSDKYNAEKNGFGQLKLTAPSTQVTSTPIWR